MSTARLQPSQYVRDRLGLWRGNGVFVGYAKDPYFALVQWRCFSYVSLVPVRDVLPGFQETPGEPSVLSLYGAPPSRGER